MAAKRTNRRVWLYIAWALLLSSTGRLMAQGEYPQPPAPSTATAEPTATAAPASAPAPHPSPEGGKGSGTQSPWAFSRLPNSANPQTAAPGPAPAPAAESNGASQTLHLVVGRSLFITTTNRLRRVYISNPKVLDSLTASPYELVISAKAAGTSTVVVWNETGESTVYTVFADIDVAGLRKALAEALPGDQIEVESQQERVFLSGVVGADAEAEAAGKLALVYSKDVINSIVVDPRHLAASPAQDRDRRS